MAEVFSANNIKTYLVKNFIPTPALSFAVKNLKLSGGVMVSASHNPAKFNGIKYRTYPGLSASSRIMKEIEKNIKKDRVRILDLKKARKKRLIETVNILTDYKKNIKRYLDWSLLKKSNLRVLIDNMYGSTCDIIPSLLKNTNIKVEAIHDKPLANFGKSYPEPISCNLSQLCNYMKKNHFDIGIALDGDGDRLGCIMPGGRFINSSQIAGLLILYFVRHKNKRGRIAKTISCSSLLDKICDKLKLNLIETPIGFKYLSEVMKDEDVLVAIEESGGIGIKDYIYDRDGIMISMLLLEMLTLTKKTFATLIKEMEKEFGRFHYHRIDIEFPQEKRKRLIRKLNNNPFKSILDKKIVNINRIDGIKYLLEDGSWLIYRFSGTEPVLRLYAESQNKRKTLKLLDFARDSIK